MFVRVVDEMRDALSLVNDGLRLNIPVVVKHRRRVVDLDGEGRKLVVESKGCCKLHITSSPRSTTTSTSSRQHFHRPHRFHLFHRKKFCGKRRTERRGRGRGRTWVGQTGLVGEKAASDTAKTHATASRTGRNFMASG